MATEPATTKALADGQPVLAPVDGQGVGELDSKPKTESDPTSGSETDEIEDGGVNEKALIRKIDWRLLPAVGILYLLSFLDRSNVGNARIEGLTDDLHMTGNQYLTGLTLYFIGYVIFEVRDSPSPPLWLGNKAMLTTALFVGSGAMQHYSQEDDAPVLAADPDHTLGHCCHAHGSGSEPLGLLCCAILLGRFRERAVSRGGLLLFNVVSTAGEAVSHLAVLWSRRPCWFLWRHLGLCESILRLSEAWIPHADIVHAGYRSHGRGCVGKRLAMDLYSCKCRHHPGACGCADAIRLTGPQEGIATVLVAVGAYWFIYNYPETAEFLSDKERRFIRRRLAADSDATHDERFTWDNVTKALRDPKCWLYGLGFHAMSLPLYTFSLFLVRHYLV